MFRKTLILWLMLALFCLSGCVTPASVTPFGACDMKMDPKYCGP